MICKNCGSELPDVSKFCSKCGLPQDSSNTAYQQLCDYSDVLEHIENSQDNVDFDVEDENVGEVEEKVYTAIGGIFLLLYIIAFGLSLKSFIIGSIIGCIIGWIISKVIGFFYKIILYGAGAIKYGTDVIKSKAVIRSKESWKKEPVYIKVNQLQETACQKYMQMSISEYEVFRIKFFNNLPDRFRRIQELIELSKQMPSYSLEQLIDTYYFSLLNQVMKTYISDFEDTLKQLKQRHENEKNKYPAETLQRLSICENSLEEFINNTSNMYYSDFLKRKAEIKNMIDELNQELEQAKEKQKAEEERIKEEISELENTLKQLKNETEKNKFPPKALKQLSACEHYFTEFIDDIDNMSYSDFSERKEEIKNILDEINQKFEPVREKERKLIERRKAEAAQRRKDFPPAYYTDVREANTKLYELKYNKFYQEQFEKFNTIRLETEALVKDFYAYEDKKETNYKLKEAEKKLITIICHTIDAIRYDDDSLIAKLPEEYAEYKKLLEESKHCSSGNYYKTNSNASSVFTNVLVASVARKILCKCDNCVYYRQGYCCETGKSVSSSGGSCKYFKYNE